MQSVEDLKTRIRSLEAERMRLKNELDGLRRSAENRAISLEGDVTAMRQELNELREILGSNAKSVPFDTEQRQQASPVTTTVTEIPTKEQPLPPNPPPPPKTPLDSAMDNLSEDELKVVRILQTHDGKYPQKSIRAEAKFSWLQANRIITRLNEQGIVTFEKNGPLDTVVLAEELKINQ